VSDVKPAGQREFEASRAESQVAAALAGRAGPSMNVKSNLQDKHMRKIGLLGLGIHAQKCIC